MARRSDILGMNARNHLFQSRYNSKRGKMIANSKLLTKSALKKEKLPVPKLYRVFRRQEDVERYDFTRLPSSFVVKPNKGLGGEGILVVDRGGVYAGQWVLTDGKMITVGDLQLHINDILLGRFSLHDLPDFAFIEERIPIHKQFERISYQGTPDLGVVVFNNVPVMAFLRLATSESGGRANMFQGSIACGIDIATGTTVHAVKHTSSVAFFPGTRRKLKGIQIPEWDEVLEVALDTTRVVGLGYARVDLAIDPKRGPVVLEVNAQPGLKIQLANMRGLKRRLERVEGLKVKSRRQGIEIGRALFADSRVEMPHDASGPQIGTFEDAEVVSLLGEKIPVKAKIDTGAFRTSIDRDLAEKLGLLEMGNQLLTMGVRSSLGRDVRSIVNVTFYLKGKKIKTTASVSDRSEMKRPMIIGRRDLRPFTVKVRKWEAHEEMGEGEDGSLRANV